MEGKSVSEQEIGRQLLKETAAYAESSLCRRKLLLHYFGENFQKENCGNCDNCLNPQKKVEAKENLCKVLNTVLATKENFKEDYLKDVLVGRATDEVCAHKHNKIEEFGCGDDVSDKVWYVVIRQAVVAGYLEKDVDNYGVLKVTDKGMDFLENPCSFKIVEDRDYENAEPNIPLQGGEACTVDPLLYQMLKDLRKRMSKDLDVPPYVISKMLLWKRWQLFIPIRSTNCKTFQVSAQEKQKDMVRSSAGLSSNIVKKTILSARRTCASEPLPISRKSR